MKTLCKVAAALLAALVLFLSGVLYTVYNAGIEWTQDTVTIGVFGHYWDFPAYTEPE